MIIFNTTYLVDESVVEQFLTFLKVDLIPTATESGELKNPRVSRILAEAEPGSGISFALQFEVSEPEKLDEWYEGEGVTINENLVATFQQSVMGFSTLMEVIEL